MSAERPTIAILDYGMGNLRSVEKAFEHVGARPYVGADPERDPRGATAWSCRASAPSRRRCARIRARGLDELIDERVEAGMPLLGICLGMQLLFDSSTENGGAEGLGLLPGTRRAAAGRRA